MKKNLTATLALTLMSIILAACSTISNPGPAPTPDPDPQPGETHLLALTLGDVDSPIVSKLQNVQLEKFDGNQKVDDYDLIIADGDTTSPDTIKSHPLVTGALTLHKPLLFVDVTEDHKRNGIGSLVGFSTKRQSDGYLLVPVVQPNGKSFYHFYTTPNSSQVPGTKSYVEAENNAFAASLVDNIAAARKPSLKAQQSTSGNVTPVEQQWIVTNTFSADPTKIVLGNQTPIASNTYTYTLFQDLSANASSGGFQRLIMSMDATADPSSPMLIDDLHQGRGWFVGAVNLWHQISDPNDSGLGLVTLTPIAQNQVSSYTSGSQFNIGLSGWTPSASYQWNSSATYSIPDWSAVGAASENNDKIDWRFWSSNPDIDHLGDWVTNLGSDVDNPNGLSKSVSEYHTEVNYRNNLLSSSTIDVDSNTVVWLYYISTSDHPTNGNFAINSAPYQNTTSPVINLSSVVPQQPSVVFGQNPVPDNVTANATVTVPEPVTGDAVVYLRASGPSSVSVVVPESVTIPAGSTTSPSFPVTISNDQDTTSVTVTAYYGQYSVSGELSLEPSSSSTSPEHVTNPDTNGIADNATTAFTEGTR